MGDAPTPEENGFGTGIARFVPTVKESFLSRQLIDAAGECTETNSVRGSDYRDGLHTKMHICTINMQLF
jgi:hypothetical protein